MATYYSLGAYEARVTIPHFYGLNQLQGEHSTNPCYAMEASNALMKGGTMMPMEKCELLPATLQTPIQTLARLHRRWNLDEGEEHDILVAAADGQLYWSYPAAEQWHLLPLPTGWEGNEYESDTWSCVNYQRGYDDEGKQVDPIDILLMSNDKDGLVYLRGDTMTVHKVDTLGMKFGTICLSNERIWGAKIPDDPDKLMYCRVERPWDWKAGKQTPDPQKDEADIVDGAGDIQVPSWDGDSFCALKQFGSYLIAIKKTKIWRILGTNPGEYDFKEQFGGGSGYPNTVAVSKSYIFMLGRQGIVAYNGESTSPFNQDYCRKIWERMNQDALDEAYGCMFDGKYYLALPLDGSAVNNAVVIYDTEDGSFMLREGIHVETFLPFDDKMYFTSSETPGQVWLWKEDCWLDQGEAEDMVWISPWMDFNYKSKTKGSFTVYLTVDTEADREITVSVQTEKKKKSKTVVFSKPAEGKGSKQKRITFGGNGRRFRLWIESKGTTPWRIPAGVNMVVETDDD